MTNKKADAATPAVDLQKILDSESNFTGDLNATTNAEAAQLEAEHAAVAARQVKASAADTEASRITTAQEIIAADAEARKAVGQKRYKSRVGKMIDPDTGKVFDNDDSTKSELTSWLQLQIDNFKIELDQE